MVAPSSFRVIPTQRPSSSSFSTSSNCNYPINHRQESLPPDTWFRNFSGLATQGFVVKTFWTPVLIFNDLRVTNPSNPRRRVSLVIELFLARSGIPKLHRPVIRARGEGLS